MKSDQFDQFSDFDCLQDYKIYNASNFNISKTVMLRNKDLLNSRPKNFENNHKLEKETIVSLGFITSLILLCAMQLYLSVNANTTIIESMNINQSAIFSSNKNLTNISSNGYHHSHNKHKLEIMMMKNLISHGKF